VEQKIVKNIKGKKRRAVSCHVYKFPEGREKHKESFEYPVPANANKGTSK
jgi:hypothetical protein